MYADNHFGRSSLDHDSGRRLADLARRAVAHRWSPHLGPLNHNPYRVAFMPFGLSEPIETAYRELIVDEKYRIWYGSKPSLTVTRWGS